MIASKFPAFRGLSVHSPVRPVYELYTDEFGCKRLRQIGTEDLFEMVQSSRELAIDAVLDRFLETGIAPPPSYRDFDQSFLQDPLDTAGDYVDNLEEVREIFGLPDSMSYKDISVFLQNKYAEFSKKDEVLNYGKTFQKADDAPSEPQINVSPDEPSAEN